MSNYQLSINNYQLPKGYKQTEVGIIPEDWEVRPFFDFCLLQRGFDITESTKKAGSIPVYSSSGLAYFHSEARVNPPGVVTGRKGILGKVFYIEKPFWPHDTTLWVKDFQGNDAKYISFFLAAFDLERFDAATSVPTLNRNNLADIPVAVPPLPEQRAIATALSNVDALIAALDKLIVKKRHLKTATMQQLLTGKKRLPGFGEGKGYKQTEVGVIPNDWEVIHLGDNADITKLAGFEYTNYFNAYRDGGEIIVVRGINITHNVLDLTDVKTIPRATSNKLPRSQLKKNDLVFAYVGTIGPVYLIEESDRYHLGPNTARITCKEDLIPEFLLVYFKSELLRKEIDEKISVGAQPSLSMTKIRSFKVIRPLIEEQRAIATVLSDMDAEISALETRRAKTQAIKQGMMQQLLTGKVRLTIESVTQ